MTTQSPPPKNTRKRNTANKTPAVPKRKTAPKKTTHKKTTHKKTTHKKIAKTPPHNIRYWLRWFMWRGGLLLIPSLCIYGFYLNHIVRTTFEGKRWTIPAQVYARPLQLQPNTYLSKTQLLQELQLLHYEAVSEVRNPGTYRQYDHIIELYSRDFNFGQGEVEGQKVQIHFAGQQVLAIKSLHKPIHLASFTLDPLLIDRIHPQHNEDRILLQLKEVAPLLLQALQVIEDRRFYSHHGIDFRAIGRAIWQNYKANGHIQGGSTITQQLVKNFYLDSSRTLWRKVNEALMSLILEWHYTKDEILEAYINEIYLGQQGSRAIHGFAMGSYYYFGRPLAELPPEHIALLVTLIRGPSYYHPKRHTKRATKRRNAILDTLAEHHYITAKQAKRAKREPLGIIKTPPGSSRYPAFISLVKRQLRASYAQNNPTFENTTIITTLNPVLQNIAEQKLSQRIQQLDQQQQLKQKLQGAVIITHRNNAHVSALVADKNPRFPGFNRVLNARRPIGSLVKPAIYLTALSQKHYTPDTLIKDLPVHVKSWKPHNYDRKSHGLIPLKEGLIHSYNLSTVNLGLSLGIDEIIRTLWEMGIRRPIQHYPSLLLGATTLSPFEVSQMYQTLADQGIYTPLNTIIAVIHDGQQLPSTNNNRNRTLPTYPTYQTNKILQQVVTRGTAKNMLQTLSPQLNIAGKTGTTNNMRDSWFAGFTGNQIATVWVGLDNNKPMGLTGASGAMKIWIDIMQHNNPAPLKLIRP